MPYVDFGSKVKNIRNIIQVKYRFVRSPLIPPPRKHRPDPTDSITSPRHSPAVLDTVNSVSCAIVWPNCMTNKLCLGAGLSASKNNVVRTCLALGSSRPDAALLGRSIPLIILSKCTNVNEQRAVTNAGYMPREKRKKKLPTTHRPSSPLELFACSRCWIGPRPETAGCCIRRPLS